jgi:hypothetical protein
VEERGRVQKDHELTGKLLRGSARPEEDGGAGIACGADGRSWRR